jgi:L-amino acid N-acyltransferase YncA
MDKLIRLATIEDSAEILGIYKPFITGTTITFEYEIPSLDEFEDRMENIQSIYPWFVCEIDNNVVGYAYASKFNERAAYDWSVDFSIYINPEYHRRNIGKALYHALLETLKLQGFCNAYALITSPNIKSECMHKSLGFKEVGLCKNVGYKMGKWLGVRWFELQFAEHDEKPYKPKSIDKVKETKEFMKILEEAKLIIK